MEVVTTLSSCSGGPAMVPRRVRGFPLGRWAPIGKTLTQNLSSSEVKKRRCWYLAATHIHIRHCGYRYSSSAARTKGATTKIAKPLPPGKV